MASVAHQWCGAAIKGPEEPAVLASILDLLGTDDAERLRIVNMPVDTRAHTALHVACKNGAKRTVQWLLEEAKANIEAKTSFGWTALHAAAAEGNVAMTEYLLDVGANKNAVTEHGWTPLHCACDAGQSRIVALLLARQVDQSITSTRKLRGIDAGSTALNIASYNRRSDLLVLFNAPVPAPSRAGPRVAAAAPAPSRAAPRVSAVAPSYLYAGLPYAAYFDPYSRPNAALPPTDAEMAGAAVEGPFAAMFRNMQACQLEYGRVMRELQRVQTELHAKTAENERLRARVRQLEGRGGGGPAPIDYLMQRQKSQQG